MVIYVDGFKGKSKKNGDPFCCVRFVQLNEDDGKSIFREFFCDSKIDISTLHFGDEVQTVFEESAFLGGMPRLVKIIKIADSPYKKILADKNG